MPTTIVLVLGSDDEGFVTDLAAAYAFFSAHVDVVTGDQLLALSCCDIAKYSPIVRGPPNTKRDEVVYDTSNPTRFNTIHEDLHAQVISYLGSLARLSSTEGDNWAAMIIWGHNTENGVELGLDGQLKLLLYSELGGAIERLSTFPFSVIIESGQSGAWLEHATTLRKVAFDHTAATSSTPRSPFSWSWLQDIFQGVPVFEKSENLDPHTVTVLQSVVRQSRACGQVPQNLVSGLDARSNCAYEVIISRRPHVRLPEGCNQLPGATQSDISNDPLSDVHAPSYPYATGSAGTFLLPLPLYIPESMVPWNHLDDPSHSNMEDSDMDKLVFRHNNGLPTLRDERDLAASFVFHARVSASFRLVVHMLLGDTTSYDDWMATIWNLRTRSSTAQEYEHMAYALYPLISDAEDHPKLCCVRRPGAIFGMVMEAAEKRGLVNKLQIESKLTALTIEDFADLVVSDVPEAAV